MGRRKQHLVLAVPDKSRRAAGRQKVGKLQDNMVGAVALKRYTLAVGLFLAWLAIMGIADADDWDALDRQACGYLEYLWENGESKGYAGDALSGIQRFLMTRRRCPGSWKLFDHLGPVGTPMQGAADACAGSLSLVRPRIVTGAPRLCYHSFDRVSLFPADR